MTYAALDVATVLHIFDFFTALDFPDTDPSSAPLTTAALRKHVKHCFSFSYRIAIYLLCIIVTGESVANKFYLSLYVSMGLTICISSVLLLFYGIMIDLYFNLMCCLI